MSATDNLIDQIAAAKASGDIAELRRLTAEMIADAEQESEDAAREQFAQDFASVSRRVAAVSESVDEVHRAFDNHFAKLPEFVEPSAITKARREIVSAVDALREARMVMEEGYGMLDPRPRDDNGDPWLTAREAYKQGLIGKPRSYAETVTGFLIRRGKDAAALGDRQGIERQYTYDVHDRPNVLIWPGHIWRDI